MQTGELINLFEAVRTADNLTPTKLNALLIKHVHNAGGSVAHTEVIAAYKELTAQGVIPFERELFERLRMKTTRTISGVAPVAVLTGPYPCPADCIFCPDAKGVPREAICRRSRRCSGRFERALTLYKSTKARMDTLEAMGHSVDKIELLIIGATWSAYPKKYQEWYVRRCLDAMNGGDPAATLEEAQIRNETATHRNVGMVIETRPDYIDMEEVRRLRWLGMTKVHSARRAPTIEFWK